MTDSYHISKNIVHWIEEDPQFEQIDPKIKEIVLGWLDHPATSAQIRYVCEELSLEAADLLALRPPRENRYLTKLRQGGKITLDTPSRKLQKTVSQMSRISRGIAMQRIETQKEPHPFLWTLRKIKDPVLLSQHILSLLDGDARLMASMSSKEAFKYLSNILCELGVVIVAGDKSEKALDPAECTGFCLCQYLAPLIFINKNACSRERLFALVYEFVCICMGVDALVESRTPFAAQGDPALACTQLILKAYGQPLPANPAKTDVSI